MSRLSFSLFRRTPISALLLVGFLNLGTPGILSASEPPKRLHSNIDERSTFALKGHTKPVVQNGLAQDQGEVSSSMVMPRMSIHFAPTSAQQADLDQFLVALQDRHGVNYHKFLTPEQYAARFGVNDADVAKVSAWLESNGFTNLQVARSKTWISFNGSAGQAAEAFHTSIHKYTLNGVPHFANASDPQLPKALAGMVTAVAGLHNFRMKSHIHMRPHFTSSQTGNTFLTPGDWATIYDVQPLYGAGFDGSPLSTAGTACGGSPCSIVVVGQSDVRATDLAAFRSAAGLAAKTITTVVVPGDRDPGIVTGDEGESDLDLEWSNGIAKNANILFVTADATIDNGVEDSITYAIDNNVAPILSTSYGLCEPEETAADMLSQTKLFQQANAQGMTIVTAAGDAGAADCDTGYPAAQGLAVDFPASSPYVTGIGGTTLNVYNTTAGGYWGAATSSTVDNISSALQYIPEIVWNDTAYDVSLGDVELAASGGGVSTVYTKPSWQVGTGVPNDGYRDVPDIALAASPDYNGLLICGDGWCTNGFRDGPVTTGSLDVTGGTSAGPPTFAGVLAMLVQKTGSPLGNINQNLYTVAGAVSNAFHDITSGSNIVPCTVGTTSCTTGNIGYAAGTGYDQATGWGSIDAYNLVDNWGADIQISSSMSTATITAGSSTTATISVGSIRGFSGTVSFSCTVASTLAGVTCSVPSTTVNTSGTTTVTITASSTASTPWWRNFRNLPPAGLGLLVLAFMLATMAYLLCKQRFVYAWGAAAVLVCMLGAVSCGGGGSSGSTSSGGGTTTTTTPAESGSVIVTATSGLIKNQVGIVVTVPSHT
jgi:subtilase family serine protease